MVIWLIITILILIFIGICVGSYFLAKKYTKNKKKKIIKTLTKEDLIKGIKKDRTDMWIFIIILIIFFWSVLGIIIGILGAVECYNNMRDKERELLNYK